MAETNEKMTFQGNAIEVKGAAVKAGAELPDFSLVGVDMSALSKESFPNKALIVLSVPSLDTPVCDLEVKRFSEEAVSLSDDVQVLAVSRDLPFAQSRWCAAQGAERIVCGSDYKERTFGSAFGTDIPEMGLLARAVFVADKEGKVVHVEYVEELAEEPDYAAAIAAAKAAA